MSQQKDDVNILLSDERQQHPPQKRSMHSSNSTLTASLPVFSYCAASILMTVTNKYVVSGSEFNMNFLLLTIQSVVAVGLLEIFKFFKLINYRSFDSGEAKKWFPIAIFLVAMIYTGSKSLQYLRIPIYTIFKNLTIILIAYGEVLWFGGSVTRLMMLSFLLMVLSSVIAGWSDISDSLAALASLNVDPDTYTLGSTFVGYTWMFANCFSSAAYVLYMRKRIKLTNFKDFDTVFYNNLLSIPLLFVLTLIFEDWSTENISHNFPSETRDWLLTAMIFSGISAFGISYTSAWCVRVTSSTTYSMVGALNKLPVAASGMIFFGDPITFGSVTAVIVGFAAGIVYTISKQQQSNLKSSARSIPLSVSSQSVADGNRMDNIKVSNVS
ncbi:uncharacterized protein VTP21DRAFT_10591 [Calcarisporiella thermophila]|uniref:uncharacterized protein n=1 Tax=Calcarisporiella thermophila TaxID=911321 RepID=UPI003742777A